MEEKHKHVQDLESYVSDIVSHKIPACKYIIAACKRHIEDMANKNFQFYFDESKVVRICSFIENMVHVEGSLTGQKVILEPWQKFFYGSVFGWLDKDSHKRRFREAALFVPRKNGKTFMAAAAGHYLHVGDGEYGSKVYCSATTEEQAFLLFNVARSMVVANKKFEDGFKLSYTKEAIFCEKNLSFFKPIIGKPRDGSNPHGAVIDEYHEHPDDGAYNSIKLGMVSREQPLLLITTTAGTNVKGPCFRYAEMGRKVVQGLIQNERLFYLEYGIDDEDDWKDIEIWRKANPNFGVSVMREGLEELLSRAKIDKSKRSEILTKNLNVWNNESIGWIDFQKWSACADPQLRIEDFEGERCWIGIDFASKVDLTSMMIVFRREDILYVFGKHYLPMEAIERPENSHYRAWVAEGWLTVAGDSRTDYNLLQEELQKISLDHNIQEVAYDPREAEFLMQQIREWAGFDILEFTQSAAMFSEPMKELEAKYLSGEIRHQDDAILNWAASNAILKSTTNKLNYISKSSYDRKIDPIVALIMAISRCMLAPKEEPCHTPLLMFLD